MERSSRLRKYHRKDYTQSVDFPVEIVGRDGRVRRYSYDESVRLYQRRIRSAIARLDDSELVDAEVRHCQLRIDQLRRSYLEQQEHPVGDGRVVGTLLGAEVYAFLARQGFDASDLGTMRLIATGLGDVVWLTGLGGRSFIVYAWRLDSEAARTAHSQQRRLLAAPVEEPAPPSERPPTVGEGVERLFVVHETSELGVLLAGEGPWDGISVDTGPAEGELEVVEGPVEVIAMRALKDGNIADALRVFEEGMELAPLRPGLALATSAVALLDQQVERARFAALFGLLHAGEGEKTRPLLSALLAISLYRMNDVASARSVIAESGPAPLPRAVSILLNLTRYRPFELFSSDTPEGAGGRALTWVRAWGLKWCACALTMSSVLGGLAVLAAPSIPILAAALMLSALLIPAAALGRLATVAGRILRAEEEPGLLLGMELLGSKGR